jgi:Domain of unknown function (DUF4287)
MSTCFQVAAGRRFRRSGSPLIHPWPGQGRLRVNPERSTHGRARAPWPKQGPASYFPSTEKKYGRSIAEWQQVIADCGLDRHMAIVGYLKSEHGMGHGHANALVGWTLAGNVAKA